ncbi:hypothetical protein KTG68_15325, partial [Acinetobacter variabilis]|nr:hypothetical protein [Acinetobacter variabilis]
MKLSALIAFATTIVLTGCASTVTTFDSHGRMIGSCKAESGFIIVKLLYYSYRIRKKLEITHRLSRST